MHDGEGRVCMMGRGGEGRERGGGGEGRGGQVGYVGDCVFMPQDISSLQRAHTQSPALGY